MIAVEISDVSFLEGENGNNIGPAGKFETLFINEQAKKWSLPRVALYTVGVQRVCHHWLYKKGILLNYFAASDTRKKCKIP